MVGKKKEKLISFFRYNYIRQVKQQKKAIKKKKRKVSGSCYLLEVSAVHWRGDLVTFPEMSTRKSAVWGQSYCPSGVKTDHPEAYFFLKKEILNNKKNAHLKYVTYLTKRDLWNGWFGHYIFKFFILQCQPPLAGKNLPNCLMENRFLHALTLASRVGWIQVEMFVTFLVLASFRRIITE